MQASLLLALTAGLAFATLPSPTASAGTRAADVVAVKAGTIYVVDRDRVVEGGGTILIRDGKVVAVDKDIDVPSGARVVDYGPDAVIVPGFVAADSGFGLQRPSDRTADPEILAVDNFDPYASYATTLAGGVTTAYVPPARARLIAGQGGVFKLAGEPGAGRAVSPRAAIHGSISGDARNTPGYWEPPVPATVDVGLGVELNQLPRTTMGAVVALRELLELAAGGEGSGLYGPYVGPALKELVKAKMPWRMTANSEREIRALLAFFGERGMPLVLDGARDAGEMAKEIKAAGVPVIVEVPYRPGSAPRDRGKQEDAVWPRYDTASMLAAEGVPFALAVRGGVSSLRFAARIASGNGLDPALALRAITLTPAEILGVADRVGSLAPGRDADFVVLTGAPLSASANVEATWVEGEIAWKAHETAATVISVDELHLGDGHVIAPGELLLLDGRIAELGRTVAHPAGATVVHGAAAMPGMIDAKGHLGLEGSTRVPPPRFQYATMVEPGDRTDRRVADAGVTTVVMTPRGSSNNGAPAMAYKPAGQDVDRMVVADPAALYLKWSDDNRLESGQKVRELLEKVVEYQAKWAEYEKALAEWTPPPPEPSKAEDAEKKGDEEEKDEGEEESKDDEKDEDGEEAAEPKPVTGSWKGEVDDPGTEGVKLGLRLRLLDDGSGELEGTLRCDAVSEELVMLEGTVAVAEPEPEAPADDEGKESDDDDDEDKEKKKKSKKDDDDAPPVRTVTLTGLGTRGPVSVSATVEEPPKPKKKKKKDDEEEQPAPERKLAGKVTVAGTELAFELVQKDEEYPVARRPERRKEKSTEAEEPKGMPKPPRTDADLEPLRAALAGDVAVVVEVDRMDEVLACVGAFDAVGIEPILFGANDAHKVGEEIAGRIRGVILNHAVTYSDSRMGTRKRNRYAELQAMGIPVAFHSGGEEGAADLPVFAAYAISEGMSPSGALRALTSDAARMFGIEDRVGLLKTGQDADVLLLDASPLEGTYGVLRVWVDGREVRLNG